MGLKSDDDIDVIFIIDGEEVENDGEWKGLTQTMNKNFKEQIALVKQDIKQDVQLVNDKVALVKQDIKQDVQLVNDKVALIKQDVQLVNDKVALVNDKVALVKQDVQLVMQEVKLAQEATKAQFD